MLLKCCMSFGCYKSSNTRTCTITWCQLISLDSSNCIVMKILSECHKGFFGLEQLNYHWPICWVICFILSFPYWFWRRVVPYTSFRLRAHGRCDRSSRDAYFSVTPDSTRAFVGGLCCPTLDFEFVFWIMINTLLTLLFENSLIKHQQWTLNPLHGRYTF
jgi:hypothetical protein